MLIIKSVGWRVQFEKRVLHEWARCLAGSREFVQFLWSGRNHLLASRPCRAPAFACGGSLAVLMANPSGAPLGGTRGCGEVVRAPAGPCSERAGPLARRLQGEGDRVGMPAGQAVFVVARQIAGAQRDRLLRVHALCEG